LRDKKKISTFAPAKTTKEVWRKQEETFIDILD